MWKPLEQLGCYREAGAAQGPSAPLLARVGQLIVTLLSSLDHQPRPKPAREGGLCTSLISSLLLLDTRQASASEELYPRLPTWSQTRVSAHQPP